MERLRITELLAEHHARTGCVLTQAELAALVFRTETGRPIAGRSRPLSEARKRNLISAWNQGRDLGRLKPRHILRIGHALHALRITDLFEE